MYQCIARRGVKEPPCSNREMQYVPTMILKNINNNMLRTSSNRSYS